MVCRCGHTDHDWETKVCLEKNCLCICYWEVNTFDSVIHDHSKYLSQLKKVEDKVRYILTNIKYTRNLPNKQFVFFYWQIANTLILNKPITPSIIQGLDDCESIRRMKQKLVNQYPEAYGPFELTLMEEKEFKQSAIMEWVTI